MTVEDAMTLTVEEIEHIIEVNQRAYDRCIAQGKTEKAERSLAKVNMLRGVLEKL